MKNYQAFYKHKHVKFEAANMEVARQHISKLWKLNDKEMKRVSVHETEKES